MIFFPLVNHIQSEGISVTVPVVMNYAPQIITQNGWGEFSVEFLYRRPTQGKTGQGAGRVEVEDYSNAKYVTTSLLGRVDLERRRESTQKLNGWHKEHQDEWLAAGEARTLVYNTQDTSHRSALERDSDSGQTGRMIIPMVH